MEGKFNKMMIKVLIILISVLIMLYSMDFASSKFKGRDQSVNHSKMLSEADRSEDAMNIPHYLYLIVSPQVWKESSQKGALVLPSHHNPFIHLAKKDQISHIAQKFWSGSDYFLLKIETEKMIGRLVYESNPGGSNKYYHLYDGEIPLASIVEATFIQSINP